MSETRKNWIQIAGLRRSVTGNDWLGLKVRHQFRTLILQTENGRYRLKNDFDEIARDGLDDWLRISEPPPFGLTFNNPEFQDDLATIIADFKPHVALLDPWNAVAKDGWHAYAADRHSWHWPAVIQ